MQLFFLVAQKLKIHLENDPQLDKDNENCLETYQHFCGGSLLNNNWMITEANRFITFVILVCFHKQNQNTKI